MAKDREKYLHKSPYRIRILKFLQDMQDGNLAEYDIKALVGYADHWRVRIGGMRIVFKKKQGRYLVVAMDSRGDIYKSL